MKKFLFALVVVFAPFVSSNAAIYLEIDGIKGEAVIAPSGSLDIAVSGNLIVESGKGVVGIAVVLDGSKSQDDSAIKTYSWRQVSGPTVRLANPTVLKPSFIPTTAGTYVFELSVVDAMGRSALAQRSEFIVGNAAPAVPPTSPSVGTVTTKPQEASESSSSKSKGNVEFNWKVEEGESAPPNDLDEIDAADDSEPITPDFSILLGGGGGIGGSGDDEAESEKDYSEVENILEDGMREAGMPTESISFNYGKIDTKVKQMVRLFGFIPTPAVATVEVDAQMNVKVKFPWWAFFASGKNGDELGQRVLTTLSNVLKTKHDTVKNSINNVR